MPGKHIQRKDQDFSIRKLFYVMHLTKTQESLHVISATRHLLEDANLQGTRGRCMVRITSTAAYRDVPASTAVETTCTLTWGWFMGLNLIRIHKVNAQSLCVETEKGTTSRFKLLYWNVKVYCFFQNISQIRQLKKFYNKTWKYYFVILKD